MFTNQFPDIFSDRFSEQFLFSDRFLEGNIYEITTMHAQLQHAEMAEETETRISLPR